MRASFGQYFFCLPALFILISSCKKESTPEQVAVEFFDILYNEHALEKAETLVTDDSRNKLHEDFKYIEGALALLASEQKIEYQFKVVDKNSRIANDSAFISVWTSLDSSTIETLLLKQNDSWLVDFNYPTEQQTKKALTEDVLEVMQDKVEIVEHE